MLAFGLCKSVEYSTGNTSKNILFCVYILLAG
jgi:hypothetical protein